MEKPAGIAPLDEKEWNFRKVPDDELAACYAHEYGREVAKRCPYILTQLKIVWRAEELPKKSKPRLSDARILPPYKSKHPDWLRGSDAQTKLISFEIPWTLTFRGFQDRTWCSLPSEIRREAVALLEKECSKAKDWMGLSIHTIRELKPSGVTTLEFFQWRDEILRARARGKVECGFFSINWSCGVGVLKKQFAEWLDSQSKKLKKSIPGEPSRGQLRDQLRWLGALRIKEHYGHKNLAEDNLPDLTKKAPYKYRPDLYQAAKRARKVIEEWIERIETPVQ